MSNKIVLVTGASGFIGRALVKTLCDKKYSVRATVRTETAFNALFDYQKQLDLDNLTVHNLGELTEQTDWGRVIENIDIIVHCAGRAHILHETSSNPMDAFHRVNTLVTTNLAKQALDAGVKRFILLSSIGVLGNTSHTTPFTDNSPPNPQAHYSQAKWQAEQALNALPNKMEKIIIRPPAVYGPGAKGNFEKLLKLIRKNIPLPLGRVRNRRQFIGIDNLIDFLMTCISEQNEINGTFMLADKETVSTTQLLNNIANAMGKKPILLPIPHTLLKWGLNFLGQSKLSEQLLGNLEIDAQKTKTLLGWEPPYTMQEQLQHTVDHKY